MAKTEKLENLSGVLRIRGAEERLEQAKKSDQGEISGESSVQFSSVAQSCLVTHGLQHARLPCPSPSPELAQTHIHQVGDAIQPSHPLSSPSPVFNLSQHQGLFK